MSRPQEIAVDLWGAEETSSMGTSEIYQRLAKDVMGLVVQVELTQSDLADLVEPALEEEQRFAASLVETADRHGEEPLKAAAYSMGYRAQIEDASVKSDNDRYKQLEGLNNLYKTLEGKRITDVVMQVLYRVYESNADLSADKIAATVATDVGANIGQVNEVIERLFHKDYKYIRKDDELNDGNVVLGVSGLWFIENISAAVESGMDGNKFARESLSKAKFF